ncbi:Arc/MetJ-type ribon-helix-helix transcriptional regulator [Rhizobium leguminosarum]|uniref:Arc/MetJ-type ribon-helix-helix transcriptional regulator n=1 Tax=Rhizobium leguminosarum TaxID=384 RepID=A0AAE2MKU4_RHILE|nr:MULTISPECIES: hypothetical protein [Rhizobium]MBB4291156.1 Arc/MetJ-type ribon-helix-helix transcriptional regulator [Rhizobium leguminosarum]MBB4297748.1 Arc/MetJ-type ribon-helix-helix transcriptional regulator [Rhizobium leguminosarum]MBB4308888.1 Arc/MetJ-type ribon-helix-helix transcriptional regulator [Rhizobium leguminosarum]MBB4416723.1 Arc/MetJ-type ribon-helix-helix transcriptional regulator [Rhizobium leguminosarum]MBB4430309.1 Arc/MetJ-type ribon-helix-helix transcriptional regu
MATVTISLPDSLKAFVESQMASKGYGNVSEYFRGLVRDAQARETRRGLRLYCLRAWRRAMRWRQRPRSGTI